jgi:hypothetical protein
MRDSSDLHTLVVEVMLRTKVRRETAGDNRRLRLQPTALYVYMYTHTHTHTHAFAHNEAAIAAAKRSTES